MTGCCYVDVKHLRDYGSPKDVFSLVHRHHIDTKLISPSAHMNAFISVVIQATKNVLLLLLHEVKLKYFVCLNCL